jgi:hypothetical protein
MSIKKIQDKLDKIDERLDRIEISLNETQTDVKYHIKRTDDLQSVVEPLHRTKIQVIGVLKFFSLVLLITAFWKLVDSYF